MGANGGARLRTFAVAAEHRRSVQSARRRFHWVGTLRVTGERLAVDLWRAKEKYMNATSDYATVKPQAGTSPLGNPWVQLIIGIICMACVANLQYGWTLFVNPIDAKYHWGRQRHSVGVQLVRSDRDLAGSRGRLSRGPLRTEMGGDRRRHPGRGRVDDQFLRELARRALCRGRRRRNRHRRGLWHLRRQCAQVVSRPARPGSRSHRRGLRCRGGGHRHTDLAHDRLGRLPTRVFILRTPARRHRVRARLATAGPSAANSGRRR